MYSRLSAVHGQAGRLQESERYAERARTLSGDRRDRLRALLDLLWEDFSSDVFTVAVKLWVAAAEDEEAGLDGVAHAVGERLRTLRGGGLFRGGFFGLVLPGDDDGEGGGARAVAKRRSQHCDLAIKRDEDLARPPVDDGHGEQRIVDTAGQVERFHRRFGGSREIVGQTVTLSGERVTVLGVMPRSSQLSSSGRFETRSGISTILYSP